MNPQRARELADKYHALQMIPEPSEETVTAIGVVWNQLRQELLHQTGRRDVRDTRAFGDPAAVFERRSA